jgi:hypothetical protein
VGGIGEGDPVAATAETSAVYVTKVAENPRFLEENVSAATPKHPLGMDPPPETKSPKAAIVIKMVQ